MDTVIVEVNPNNVDYDMIKRAGEIIRNGGLVAFPTETVYGLGGEARNRESSRKIYAAKGRPSDNPLIVHISKWESLEMICDDIPPEAQLLADAFWPGPLTMIVKKNQVIPKETTGGLDTVAVRMPDHKVALDFIEAAGGFIAAPSANTSGKPSPTVAEYVTQDMNGKIEMIIDGGEVGIGVESTIVDLTEGTPTILRPGYITEEMLERVLGEVDTDRTILDNNSGVAPKAPGMKYRHYAPKGDMMLVDGLPDKVADRINELVRMAVRSGEKVGVMLTDEIFDKVEAPVKKAVGPRSDEHEIARRLYRILREFDDEGVTKIFSESFSDKGFGQAVMNRLLKAAGFNVIKA